MPNVVNQTAAVAQAILEQDGFNVPTTSTPAPASQMVQPGTVYNQNPAAQQVEPKGTLIQIFVQPQNGTSTPTPSNSGTPTDTATPTTATPTDGGTPTTTPTQAVAWAACSGQRCGSGGTSLTDTVLCPSFVRYPYPGTLSPEQEVRGA